MTDFEKLGQFYLGKKHDLGSGQTSVSDLVMYDSKDLTTHAVCVGMTGSGKTGLCLSLLEEAAIDGIPTIAIDPKGDLGNLMLTFPHLRPEDFEPWIEPSEAVRQGLSPAEMAKKVADTWTRGLSEWGQSGERIQRFRDAAEVAIYTPASNAGRPLTVLKSFNAPTSNQLQDAEAYRDRIMSAVSGLLALLQIQGDPISSREHILLSSLFDYFWKSGQNLEMGQLIQSITAPPFTKVGFLDLESFYPGPERFKLAMMLNNLLSAPGFAAWLEGETLDIPKLLHTPEGKPRIAVISIAHLSDQERMFFVTILLNEILSWIRTQPGTSSLRAILYMDEVFGYFPPTANPPSKTPMLTLLKQARAYGLGCVLATQNPVDLDYKGLSNTGTWFLGRLQTERDKLRVLEGLEGAAASTGANFDRAKMEQILAGLGSRVFLMNNVHEDQPVIFRSRWALSYLRGPVTRQQIEQLMRPMKSALPTSAAESGSRGFAAPTNESPHENARPVLPPGISEAFFPVKGSPQKLLYRPALLGQARAHYVDSKSGIDHWDEITLLRLAADGVGADPWAESEDWDERDLPQLNAQPYDTAVYRDVPQEMLQKKSYTGWESALKAHLYRTHRLSVWKCPELKMASGPGETEAAFRVRISQKAREQRDLQVEKLRAKHQSKFATIEDQLLRAQQRVEREKSQKSQKTLSTAVSIGGGILGALFGRKAVSATNLNRAGSAIKSASGMAKEAEDIRQAEQSVEAVLQKKADLAAKVEEEVQAIQHQFDPQFMTLDASEIAPRKSDLTVDKLTLVWLPYNVTGSADSERAF